ncbi:MAG: hypothetical protein OXI08_02350 [Cyanobacteria bacterium MAG IRC4_bin_6]|nr:hypothetical protein [Cyanobacteria bacterium MAG IRC4_bin_6]
MGLTHCPLCVGLAVVAALRFCAHGWLLVASGLLEVPPLALMERKLPRKPAPAPLARCS